MDAIQRHSAGATVTHRSVFASLEVPTIEGQPSEAIINRWVAPLYTKFFDPSAQSTIAALRPEMTEDLACQLLSYRNWRPRIVGAHIVALQKYGELTDHVGRLLVRSDVCYAGEGYCHALARLNTSKSRQYLFDYLEYYLTQPDLWFDQGCAMGAVAYLDGINSSKELSRFMDKWTTFIQNKPNWDLARSCLLFEQRIEVYSAVDQKKGSGCKYYNWR